MVRKIGLVVCGLLAVLDVAGVVGLWQHPGPSAVCRSNIELCSLSWVYAAR